MYLLWLLKINFTKKNNTAKISNDNMIPEHVSIYGGVFDMQYSLVADFARLNQEAMEAKNDKCTIAQRDNYWTEEVRDMNILANQQ